MNARLRATLQAGQAQGRLLIDDIEIALVSVLGIVSAAIQTLTERPPAEPRVATMQFVIHILSAMQFVAPLEQRRIAAQAAALVTRSANADFPWDADGHMHARNASADSG